MSDDLKKYGLSRAELKLQLTREEDLAEFPGRRDIRDLVERGFNWTKRIGELPHMVLWGSMGAGKTHLKYYVRHKFKGKTDFDIKIIEFNFEPVDKTVVDLYRKIVDGLGKSFVKQLCIDFYEELKKNTDEEGNLMLPTDGSGTLEKERQAYDSKGIGEDLQSVIKYIVVNPYDAGPMNLAWSWFSAEKLSKADKDALKVSHDTSTEADVNIRLEEIFQMNNIAYKGNKRIVILADEAHQIDESKAEAATTALLRKMLELPSCSVVLVITAADLDDMHFMEESLMRRITEGGFNGMVELPQFDTQGVDTNPIRDFVVELLKYFRPPGCSLSDLVKDKKDEDDNTLSEDIFPFTEKAITIIPEWCSTQNPPYALFPGRISDALTHGLQIAQDTNKDIVDEDCFN